MNIAGREIGPQEPPYIISEISCNHMGVFENAIQLIDVAKEAGADAVKFQCVEPDDITIDCNHPDFTIKGGTWQGQRLYDLYQKCKTPYEWFPELFAHARAMKITPFASVFSKRGIDMLEKLDCPAYKIASCEITDIGLIQLAANTGKPVIISTGMASDEEVIDAYNTAKRGKRAVLICTSGYPAPVEEARLHRISRMSNFEPVGVSDHSTGATIPIIATALGAHIIEKHLMLAGTKPEDKEFSATPSQFREIVSRVRQTWAAIQPSTPRSEEATRQLRRSLRASKDIAEGEDFTPENVRAMRPAGGLEPRLLPEILGRKAHRAFRFGEPILP